MPPLTEKELKGYYETQSAAAKPLSPLEYKKSLNTGLLSTENAESKVLTDMNTLKGLADQKITQIPPAPIVTSPPSIPTSTTYINPGTGAEITNATKEQAEKEGLVVSGGDLPPWYGKTEKQIALEQEIADLDKQTESSLTELTSFQTSQDAVTQQEIENIKKQYETRREEMRDINKRREAQLSTLGTRTGGERYTASFGGILAEEERAGIKRLSQLDAEETSLINAALQAQQNRNWEIFNTKMSLIEKTREQKQAQLEELNRMAVLNSERIVEMAKEERERAKEERETFKFKQEQMEKTSDEMALNILSLEEEPTDEELDYFARANNVDPLMLRSSIEKEERNRFKDLQGKARDYASFLQVTGLSQNNFSFDDYLDTVDASRGIDREIKEAQLAKTKAEINKLYTNIARDMAISQGASPELLAYAQQYAATGRIPTGLPKGTFGKVSKLAKSLPKPAGTIVDRNTRIKPDGNDTLLKQYGELYAVIQLAKDLKEMDKKRLGGFAAGSAGKIVGSKDQQEYIDLRESIIDVLSRERTGAALTVSEQEFYKSMLPGRLDEPFGIGADSQVRIDNFINNLSSELQKKTATQGWSIYGLSEIKVGNQKYKVGDIIQNKNGEKGKINPDGTITPL